MNDEISALTEILLTNKWEWSLTKTTFTFSKDGLSIENGKIMGSWVAEGRTLMFEYGGGLVTWSLHSLKNNGDELHLLGYFPKNKTWKRGYLKKI